MASITMTAGKDFLDACSIHTRETALSLRTGAEVSTMTWDGAPYVFTITTPEPASQTTDEQMPLEWNTGGPGS
jgi:hypothetical protein